MSNLFKPKIPAAKPPATIPDEEAPEVTDAALVAQEAALKKGGRRSTILSQGGNFDSFNRATTG